MVFNCRRAYPFTEELFRVLCYDSRLIFYDKYTIHCTQH